MLPDRAMLRLSLHPERNFKGLRHILNNHSMKENLSIWHKAFSIIIFSTNRSQLQFYYVNPFKHSTWRLGVLKKILLNFTKQVPYKLITTPKNKILIIHFYFMKKINIKMNDTKNRFKFLKKINLKLTTQKNQFLIIHFNFIFEITLKMKEVKKIILFNFMNEISLKCVD